MIYLDTSVLISAFRGDVFSDRVLDWLDDDPPVTFSDWTLAEFSSAMSNLMRQDILEPAQRRQLDERLDFWLRDRQVSDIAGADIRFARTLVRQSEVLRSGDAVHLAIAVRHGYSIATFDKVMHKEAARIGLEVVEP